MACKVPVVATNGGSLPEVVGDAGVIVPKKDGPALAKAIGELLDDPVRRAHLAETGYKRIHEKFLWSRCASDLIEVYREVIDANRPAG
jgi:glycosyltransferase involved in cell wall biosynthesis